MEREKTQREFQIDDRLNKPLYGAIAWAGISIGTIVIVLTSPRHESQSVYQDDMISQEKVERQINPLIHGRSVFADEFVKLTPTPTPEKLSELPSPIQEQEVRIETLGGAVIRGPATYYGVDDEYGLEDPLGCTGEPFDPYDPKTAARPENSPFVCGDKIEVCDVDSCIEAEIRDTCPGCAERGIVLDLSYGAMGELTGKHGTAMVTIRKK